MQRPQPENQTPHRFQTLEGQLKPDGKQQENDTEFGELVDRMRAHDAEGIKHRPDGGHASHDIGPQQNADQQKPQNTGDFITLEDGYNDRGSQ